MNDNKIGRFILKPRNLFLIDSLGALVTAFFLFAILRTFNEYFGMPQITLTYLSIIAVVFCLYSFTCFILLKDNWQPFLKTISIANLLYCCLTLTLVIYHFQRLTILGITYFFAEIIVVCGLGFVELKTLSMGTKRINDNS